MEIMNLPRCCGKSTNIIIEAVKTGYPIYSWNKYAEKTS